LKREEISGGKVHYIVSYAEQWLTVSLAARFSVPLGLCYISQRHPGAAAGERTSQEGL